MVVTRLTWILASIEIVILFIVIVIVIRNLDENPQEL